VKFQTFSADRVVLPDAPKARYQTLVTDPAESQRDMLAALELDPGAYRDLIALCAEEGILFTSTPYNEEDIEFLDKLGVPLLKAASIQAVEPAFLRAMAETGRPLVVSTGMTDWDEAAEAVEAIRATGQEDFVLLQCTSNYPSRLADSNVRAMAAMADRFDCLVGYSDHTQTNSACLAAVALGGCVLEKHLTLDHALPGPDHSTSATPEEFAVLVAAVREIETVLGSPEKAPTEAERANMVGMRRSITTRRAIPAGTVISAVDLICRRPATGMPPRDWDALVGRRAKHDIAAGAQIRWEDVVV
jgi:N-acetylneuraminate synthase/N,N'-diacetyllegionaminate synthase